MRNWSAIIPLVLIFSASGGAQDRPAPAAKKQFPLEVSFINHSVTMPFHGFILDPIHPGFNLGTEYVYSQGHRVRFYQSLQAGYYFNKYNAKALYVMTGPGLRYTFRFGLFVDAGLGIGYLHSFHVTEIFAQDASGEYVRVKDNGKPAFVVFTGLGLGWDFSARIGWPICLFVRYQPYIQTPYNLQSSIFPQALVHFGVRVQL